MEYGFIRLLEITVEELMTVVVIITTASIGVIQFIKEMTIFKSWSKRLLTVLVVICVTLINTRLVPGWVTVLGNTVLLSLSLLKIGYDTIIDGIPKIIKTRMGVLGTEEKKTSVK